MIANISYSRSYEAWQGYTDKLKKLIDKYSIATICEVGGGANPTLSLEYISTKKLNYTILDISKNELDKAPSSYNKVVADICSNDLVDSSEYDLVFTKMLAEHIKNGELLHKNILRCCLVVE
jgi:Methyltransferase domain.